MRVKTVSEGLLKLTYAVLLLSFGSGVAALIYEIVWFQLLELVIGSTAVSLGILLATFMGGMCLGSLILSAPAPIRDRSRHRHSRNSGVVPDALRRQRLLGRGVPSAPDPSDGRDAARPGSSGRRSFSDGTSLWREHRRSRARMPALRFLFAARVRCCHRDLCCHVYQRGRRGNCLRVSP